MSLYVKEGTQIYMKTHLSSQYWISMKYILSYGYIYLQNTLQVNLHLRQLELLCAQLCYIDL